MKPRRAGVRILIAGHSPTASTGYGRVTRRLAIAFADAGHTVAALSPSNGTKLPYQLLQPHTAKDGESLAHPLQAFAPDVLLTVGDPWMFSSLPTLAERSGLRWIAYFPVDGRPLPDEWKRWISAVDVPIVFSQFTQELVARALGKRPALIPHGVDTVRFCPADKIRSKELLQAQGKFVVGTVARNQQRKNLPALVKAFAAFADGKADVLLYLHTQPDGEWDLPALARHFEVECKTRMSGSLSADRGVSDEQLVAVYNAMDLFVLPTMAEGFGLPIIESQACGTPALVTDFSACPELVVDRPARTHGGTPAAHVCRAACARADELPWVSVHRRVRRDAVPDL